MPRARSPINEEPRVSSLEQQQVLDTPPEDNFDQLTALAQQLFDVPVALISLVDRERQWFKSKAGLCLSETSRDASICAHAILQNEPLVISDASKDPRSFDNPLVTGEPLIRFYAGAPIFNDEGFALGTFCIIDNKPRQFSADQIETLKRLADQAAEQFRLRKQAMMRISEVDADHRFSVGRAACLTFAAGVLATSALAIWSYRTERDAAAQRFDQLSRNIVGEIRRRVQLPVYGMKGARGVFAASEWVSRDEFDAYVNSRDLPGEFPGVLGFEFVRRVGPDETAQFLAEQRASGAIDFSIREFAPSVIGALDRYVVTYAAPNEIRSRAQGLDIGSEPVRRAAVEHAIDTGTFTVTAPLELMGVKPQRGGLLYLLPVYENGQQPKTPAERRRALSGLICAPVALDKILNGVVEAADDQLEYRITDDGAANTRNEVYNSLSDSAGRSPPVAVESAGIRHVEVIGLGGRLWNIRSVPTAKFLKSVAPKSSIAIAIVGLLGSLLLAATVWALTRSRARAYSLAARMTAGLSKAKASAERFTTEIRLQAVQLQSQEERLVRTNRLARVGGWELNLATDELLWTDEVYYIHELEVGTPINIAKAISFYSSSSREKILEAIDLALCHAQSWDLELELITATGRSIWVRAQGERLDESGKPVRLCGAFHDITARKQAEEQLRRLATHDKLTGLPNRLLLNERMQHSLARYQKNSADRFSVFFLDFDRFKLTNDTLGHDAGDELLKQIAARLREATAGQCFSSNSEQQPVTIARLGGDEFVLILNDNAVSPTEMADRLLDVLATPYQIAGNEVVSTASIGIVECDASYSRADDILRDADIAMYEAKAAGKARYVLFDTEMRCRVQRRVTLEADLRSAVESDQLTLVYQPVVNLSDGKMSGVESLLRWQHPTHGLIPTKELLPIAEETSLILTIGRKVLREACGQFMQWRSLLGENAPGYVSVNLCWKQLVATDLVSEVRQVLRETAIPPACLHLEIRESTLVKHLVYAKAALAELHALGVRIDMDDFGTGHSSMTMLHQLPIDSLKIDGSFVSNLDHGREFIALTQAVTQLAQNLNITVVAEGIELIDQVAILQSIGCEYGQGHFFGQPLNATDVGARSQTSLPPFGLAA